MLPTLLSQYKAAARHDRPSSWVPLHHSPNSALYSHNASEGLRSFMKAFQSIQSALFGEWNPLRWPIGSTDLCCQACMIAQNLRIPRTIPSAPHPHPRMPFASCRDSWNFITNNICSFYCCRIIHNGRSKWTCEKRVELFASVQYCIIKQILL